MKTTLEPQDIEAIALRVLEMLRPHLDGNGKAEPGNAGDFLSSAPVQAAVFTCLFQGMCPECARR